MEKISYEEAIEKQMFPGDKMEDWESLNIYPTAKGELRTVGYKSFHGGGRYGPLP